MKTRPDGSAEARGLRALEFLDRLNTQPDVQTALELSDWMAQSPENEREFMETSTLFHAASLGPRLQLSTDELVARAKKHFADEAVNAGGGRSAVGGANAGGAVGMISTAGAVGGADATGVAGAAGAADATDAVNARGAADAVLAPDVALSPPSWFRREAMRFAIAAGLVAVVAAGTTFYVTRPQPVPPTEYRAAAHSEGFTLEDRSFTQLYEQSRLDATMSKDTRLVKLVGNGAAFKVEHDPRPFRVDVAGLSITAKGTQFNVIRREENHETYIYLAEGRLNVRGPRVPPLEMAPGDIVKIHDRGAVVKTRADAARRHNLQVDGMTYAQVAAAINRENVIFQIEVRGAAAGTPARGVVDLTGPEAWLGLLRSNGLQVKPETGLRIVEAAEPD